MSLVNCYCCNDSNRFCQNFLSRTELTQDYKSIYAKSFATNHYIECFNNKLRLLSLLHLPFVGADDHQTVSKAELEHCPPTARYRSKKTITFNLGQISNVLTWFTIAFVENFRKIVHSLAVQQGTRRDNIRVQCSSSFQTERNACYIWC